MEINMKKIAIIPNPTKDLEFALSKRVSDFLISRGAHVCTKKEYSGMWSCGMVVVDEIPIDTELLIVVGGDGSVIDASVTAVELGIPVLGVNLGNLGYLAEVEPSEIEIMEKLFSGDYIVEERMLLSVSAENDGVVTTSARYAVNDIIISHDTYVGLAELSLNESNGAGVKYRADGLILSTPIGSTAYSLSAGGPIVSHDIDSIVATPICPHSFFNRSIIFKPDEVLTVSNNGDEILNITIDGRFFTSLVPGGKCTVTKSCKRFKMLSFSANNMFQALFGKMKRFENI